VAIHTETTTVEPGFKYWAFISYSHRDRAIAQWLHHALESYRVPRRLVGKSGAYGPLPRRLYPVFRDRDELPSSSDLSAAIESALRASRSLIVIASPHAAVSRWVDEEIRRFRALGRGARVLCLIADGEPHAARHPGSGQLECLPPALREDAREPIAADLRPGGDGRAAARLKLLAGVLGVGLDELRRRERRRRLLRALAINAAAIALLVGGALGWRMQQRSEQEALAAQALQARIGALYEKGRQALLDREQGRAALYLATVYRLGVDTPALRLLLARAMRVVDAQRSSFFAGAPVMRLAFSPDAQRLATLDSDNRIRIWNANEAQRLAQFKVPQWAAGYGPRFSRDGRRVYFGGVADRAPAGFLSVWDAEDGRRLVQVPTRRSADHPFNAIGAGASRLAYVTPQGAVAIYDLERGRPVRQLPGRYSVAGYSRDGRRLLLGGSDGQVQIRDATGRVVLRRLRGLHAAVVALDDSSDGDLVAASSQDGAVRVWQAANGVLRLSAGHPAPNPLLVFTMDGRRLLTRAADGARIWDLDSGALVYDQKFANSASSRVDVSPQGHWVMTGSGSQLLITDADSGLPLYGLEGHDAQPPGRDISEDDRKIAAGGSDGRVVIWDKLPAADFEFRHAVDPADWAETPRPPGVAAVFDHAGRRIATGGGDGRLQLWDVQSHQRLYRLQADPRSVNVLAFSRDDRLMASGGEVSGIKVWNVADGRLLQAFDCGGRRVLTLEFGGDGRTLAAALSGGTTRIWALDRGTPLAAFVRDEARAGAYRPDGRFYALGVAGAVKLWDLSESRMVWSTPLPEGQRTARDIGALRFSADGRRILAASFGRGAAVLDARDGRVLQRFDEGSASQLDDAAFDRAGTQAVFADRNGLAWLWRLRDGTVRVLRGHAGAVYTAEFSPDGNFVLTSGADGTARLWDAARGELLDLVAEHARPMPEAPFAAASFSPDGRWVLTGSIDGLIRLSRLRQETRTPAQLDAILRCRLPWRLAGETLQPSAPGGAGCGAAEDSGASGGSRASLLQVALSQ
jgi:WD40 repeat protein